LKTVPDRSTALPSALTGKPIDGLTAAERWKNAGVWVAIELYTPQSMPLRQIAATGASAEECMAELSARGLDPTRFEFVPLAQPYQP
jgi:hypothetical protein